MRPKSIVRCLKPSDLLGKCPLDVSITFYSLDYSTRVYRMETNVICAVFSCSTACRSVVLEFQINQQRSVTEVILNDQLINSVNSCYLINLG